MLFLWVRSRQRMKSTTVASRTQPGVVVVKISLKFSTKTAESFWPEMTAGEAFPLQSQIAERRARHFGQVAQPGFDDTMPSRTFPNITSIVASSYRIGMHFALRLDLCGPASSEFDHAADVPIKNPLVRSMATQANRARFDHSNL